jgi:hypothetical protein
VLPQSYADGHRADECILPNPQLCRGFCSKFSDDYVDIDRQKPECALAMDEASELWSASRVWKIQSLSRAL